MVDRTTEEAEILALIEELTVAELCLAEEMRCFGQILSAVPAFSLEREIDSAH